jgi:Restriction endonuclease S subunits
MPIKTHFYRKLLGDILVFKNGKSIKPGGIGEYPVYGSNGIIGGGEEYREQNGIIIGRVGAYCGSVSFYPGKFWASDNTIIAYPKNANYDVVFISYLLKELNLNHWAGGAAQPLLTQIVLKQIEASVPPLPTQRKIAAVLSAYDDLVENNTRRIQILEEMAQALYREWFVNFRFPGHEKVRMEESELGPKPEGWEAKSCGM